MNDIIIYIDTETGITYCEYNKIGIQHANLQNKLIFKMSEKIQGSAWLEYEIDNIKKETAMEETADGYQVDIRSCLLISNEVKVDLKITQAENGQGIPIFISSITNLTVLESINTALQEPEYYPDWKTIADSKIAELNQLKDSLNENETTRQAAEATRIANEAERVENETQREEYIEQFKQDVQSGVFNGKDGPQGVQGEPGQDGKDGKDGGAYYPYVYINIETGYLMMVQPEEAEDISFNVNENGYLEVILND